MGNACLVLSTVLHLIQLISPALPITEIKQLGRPFKYQIVGVFSILGKLQSCQFVLNMISQ